MLEQTIPHALDNGPKHNVEFAPIEGAEYDHAMFKQAHEAWLTKGECAEPVEIGKIRLDPEALIHLSQNAPNGFIITDGTQRSLIAEDDVTAEDQAERELLDKPLDQRSRAILRDLYTKFGQIVQDDISAKTIHKTPPYVHIDLRFGMYRGEDDLHIDAHPALGTANGVRYITTIEGPTTRFFTGSNFGLDYFDEDGNLQKPTPDSIKPTDLEKGSVIRFLEQGNPHVAPTAEEPVFRIILTGTARLQPIGEQS